MGRPRKPVTELKAPKKSRLTARLAELSLPAGPLGPPPEWFHPLAVDEWQRVTMNPQYSAVLNPVHRGGLIHYCALHARMVRREMGEEIAFSASDQQTLSSLRMQLGLTPASQTKVRLPGEKKAEESKWAATKPIPIQQPA